MLLRLKILILLASNALHFGLTDRPISTIEIYSASPLHSSFGISICWFVPFISKG